jgi:hypothetical protein
MSWALAFLIVGALIILCPFVLFITVYVMELRREEKIIASYGDHMKGGYIDMPIVYLDKLPMGNQPLNPAVAKDKKIIN